MTLVALENKYYIVVVYKCISYSKFIFYQLRENGEVILLWYNVEIKRRKDAILVLKTNFTLCFFSLTSLSFSLILFPFLSNLTLVFLLITLLDILSRIQEHLSNPNWVVILSKEFLTIHFSFAMNEYFIKYLFIL